MTAPAGDERHRRFARETRSTRPRMVERPRRQPRTHEAASMRHPAHRHRRRRCCRAAVGHAPRTTCRPHARPSRIRRPQLHPCVEADAALVCGRSLECSSAAGPVPAACTHPSLRYVPRQLDAIDRTASACVSRANAGAGEAIADARELEYDVLILAFGGRANDSDTRGCQRCHFMDGQAKLTLSMRGSRTRSARRVQNRTIDVAIVVGGATASNWPPS